jgi:AraC family transcriptional regulator, positive regulator of tynA and feaB
VAAHCREAKAERQGEAMQNLFISDGKVSPDDFTKWAAVSAREFYDGELEIESLEQADVRLEKGLSFPVSLTRLSARCDTSYRRGWPHIRGNKVGFRTIWFVRKGTLRIVRSQGVCDVEQGQMGVVDSSAPFQVKTMCDPNGEYESFQLVVPGPMFLMHLQEADKLMRPVDLDTPQGRIVQDILALLVKDGEHLGRTAAKHLSEGLLVALADHLEGQQADISRRQQLVAKRLSDIQNYILMNLTDPDLSFERVASNCGISPRYLCYVLKANRTSFSRLLWRNRLAKAKDLLLSPATRDYPIHEVAYMSGFKSAAHFSRMFKSAFGCPPRKFRKGGGETMREADEEFEMDDLELRMAGNA